MMPLKGYANRETSSAREGPDEEMQESKTCHQCHKKGRKRSVLCTNCLKSYCIGCISKWYKNMDETYFAEACAECRSNCNCLKCLQIDGTYKDMPIPSFRLSTEDMLHQSAYVVRVLVPSLKQLVLEQDMEKECEAKIQGLCVRGLQLTKVHINDNYKLQCNNCKMSIFDIHRSCQSCSYKLCVTCCREIRDASSLGNGSGEGASCWFENVNLVSGWKVTGKGTIACPPETVGGCGLSNLKLNSIYPSNWLSELIMKAEAISKVCRSDVFEYSEAAGTCLRSDLGNGSRSQISCRAASGVENVDNYSHFWWHLSHGEPVNIPNVLNRTFGLSWEPTVMLRGFRGPLDKRKCRSQEINALNCLNWCEERTYMGKFFKEYSEGRTNILAMQDWPPAEPLHERLPRHFAELMRCLPFMHYTDPQAGCLNLAAKIPKMLLESDLGPKLCINYGANKEYGLDSVTNLQYALSDKVSVLMHATERRKLVVHNYPSIYSNWEQGFAEAEGDAVWEIFRREDVPQLEDYLKKHFWEFRRTYPLQQMVHPIQEKAFYLTVKHKSKLKEEYGIEPKTFIQRQGDAVIIPAGCPYQVRYLKSCTSAAVNFVSVEGVRECLRLSKEYRSLPCNHRFKEDQLKVGQIILHSVSKAVQCLEMATDNLSRRLLGLASVPLNLNNDPFEPEYMPAFEFMKEQLEMMRLVLQKEGLTVPRHVRLELERGIQDLLQRIVSRPGSSTS